MSDISTVIGAVGGGAVLSLFGNKDMFAWYSVGLAVGFFAYFGVGWKLGEDAVSKWMGK